jgi:hypothetical protein
VKKRVNPHKAANGMLAALHPSGTIHVGGSSSVNTGMLSTDFKMTMKHNNSNHSIQSTKKMISTIRKPTDLLGNGAFNNNNNGGAMNANNNMIGPGINQMVLSGKKNLQ